MDPSDSLADFPTNPTTPVRNRDPSVAVLIPCFNEEITVGSVVQSFRSTLPSAAIYVYDNNSTDRTVDVARSAGAIVRSEGLQGKGHVVRRMFGDVDADVYVLVDGDNTYDAAAAPQLIEMMVAQSLDMVTGCRVSDQHDRTYRRGHRLGNQVLTGLVGRIFANRTKDMLSGYRVLSRRFVKSFPALSRGFEIETELTVHALELTMPIADIDTRYSERPAGSESKLNTIRDGFRVLGTILYLIKEGRPLAFFWSIAGISVALSLSLAYPIIATFLDSGQVPRFPTAILSASIMIVAVLSFFSGLILDTVARGRREAKRLAYLRYPAPQASIGWASHLDE